MAELPAKPATISASANALETNYKCGISLNSNYTLIENSYISDIHGDGAETHGISGANGLGNTTINNDFVEATGEDFFTGGAEIFLPSPDLATNLTITNNYFTKNIAWNPGAPQFVKDPNDPNYGIGSDQMDVKNDIELKAGIDVTISNNLFENVWVGADQRGQAINISDINQEPGGIVDTWINVAYVTITDNVFRNCGSTIALAAGDGADSKGPTQISHDFLISNNLGYNIGGIEWGDNESQVAMGVGGKTPARSPISPSKTTPSSEPMGFSTWKATQFPASGGCQLHLYQQCRR